MSDIEILGLARSSYTRVVRIVCEEKGVPYKLVNAAPHTSEVKAIHPFGKLPVLRHGAFTLCESRAIAAYIDIGFPGPRLTPVDPKLAALCEQWISLVNSQMDAVLVRTYVFHYIFPKTPDGKPDRKSIEEMAPTMRHHVSLLDRAVAKTGFLAGDSYTLADMNVIPILYWLRQFPEGGEAMAQSKNLSGFYERNAARPSFLATTPPPMPPHPPNA